MYIKIPLLLLCLVVYIYETECHPHPHPQGILTSAVNNRPGVGSTSIGGNTGHSPGMSSAMFVQAKSAKGLGPLSAALLYRQTKTSGRSFTALMSKSEGPPPQSTSCVLLDDSGSVESAAFQGLKNFLKEVINSETNPMRGGSLNLKMMGITFSEDARTQFHFTDDPNNARVSVDRIPYREGSSTCIGCGLVECESHLNRVGGGGSKLIFIMTDAESNHGPDPVPIATRLRSQGVVVVVAAVPGSDHNKMVQLTGDPGLVLSTGGGRVSTSGSPQGRLLSLSGRAGSSSKLSGLSNSNQFIMEMSSRISANSRRRFLF